MVVEKLPEVVPPSGRVPGRGLLVLPILEARRRRNIGEIAKKGSRHGGFTSQGINRRRGAARGATRGPSGPLARPHPGQHPWWWRSSGRWFLPPAGCREEVFWFSRSWKRGGGGTEERSRKRVPVTGVSRSL